MRVLLAPADFGPDLDAHAAAAVMARTWRECAPHDDVEVRVVPQASSGLVGVVAEGDDASLHSVPAHDVLGREAHIPVALRDEGGTDTAYLDASDLIGESLVPVPQRDPGAATSLGVGEAIEAARGLGASRVVVTAGVGLANDGGAGLLAGLSTEPRPELAAGGLALAGLALDQLDFLPGLRDRYADIDLVLATDEDAPLLGLAGTSHLDGPARGADPETAQRLESALGHFADLVNRVLPARADLLSGAPRRPDREAGAGAGGGVGFALLALGGRRVSAIDHGLRLTQFPACVDDADLVVTGQGLLDFRALESGPAAAVARTAQAAAKPVVAIAGQLMAGRRETMSRGFSAAYACADSPIELEAYAADPADALHRRTAAVARTWSPAR